MKRDLTGTRTWSEVSEFFRRLYEPGFGRPVDLSEIDVRPGSRDIVATALVFDAAEGAGRRAVVTVRDGRLVPVSAGTADSFSPRWSADGEYLAFLSERRARGVSQLQVLARSAVGEAEEISVPGTVEQLAWSPQGHRVLLRVAGLREGTAGPGSSGTPGARDDAPAWMPRVEGGRDAAEGRTLWLADAGLRTARRVTGDDITVWEAGWAGPGRAVAVTSADRTDSAWYFAQLSVIGLKTASARRC